MRAAQLREGGVTSHCSQPGIISPGWDTALHRSPGGAECLCYLDEDGDGGLCQQEKASRHGCSYTPKAITLNGKSSMSRRRTNWVNCGADSLNREREKGLVVVKMMLRLLCQLHDTAKGKS